MSSLFLLQVSGAGIAESELVPSFETRFRECSSEYLTVGTTEQIPLVEFAHDLRGLHPQLRFGFHMGPVYRIETQVDPTRRVLGTLSRMAPSGSFLATEAFCSQLELGISGVDEWSLRYLDESRLQPATSRQPIVDENIPRTELRELSTAAAIELFWVAARRVRPGFEVTDSNIEVIREITRVLNRNPVAIEVAARSLRSMNVEGLLGNVEKQHESEPIELSVLDSAFLPDRLSKAAEFLQLFDGPFGRDTALTFLKTVDLSGDTSELFESLVERGLLRTVEPDNENIPPLFERTVGGYSRKHVDDISSKAARAFVDAYCRKASDLRRQMWGPDEPSAIERIKVAYDNFRRVSCVGYWRVRLFVSVQ